MELGDAILAESELRRIGEEFLRIDSLAPGARSPTVFVRYNTVASLHCHVTVYFRPEAEDLARQVGAEPCATPMSDGLEPMLPEHP